MPRLKPTRNVADVLDRLLIHENGCWMYPGCQNHDGYCQVFYGRKGRLVHRLVYEHFCGPIPEGLVLDHLCRNRACANPWHLEPVTRLENFLRGKRPAKKTHCLRGHPLIGDNLRIGTKGEKFCRACVRIRAAKSRRQRKGAL